MDNIKKTELNHLQADLADEISHNTQYKALLGLAMIVTLISYLFFSGHLKLGNPLYWGEYFSKGTATMAAFFFMFASVILLGVFLAWVKHFAYSHFTTYRAIAGVMVTLVGFALMAEMFAALEDQKAKADIQLEGNAAYKATITPTISSISAPPALAGDIAAASQKLARCQANLGKPGYKHCDGDKAALAALEKQQSAALNAQVVASAESEKLRYERQDKMKADAHNDFIVGLAQFYSSVAYALSGEPKPENAYIEYIAWGNITLMLIIAIAFERLHAFLIEAGRDIKGNIRGIEQRIAQLQQGSSNYAGLSHLPPVGSPLFKYQDEPKDGGFKTTGIGFTAPVGKPTTAQSGFVGFKDTNGIKPTPAPVDPNWKYINPTLEKREVRDIMDRGNEKPTPAPVKADKPEIIETSGFKQSPEQRAIVDRLHQEQMKTYREELRGGSHQFKDVPLDRPTPARPAHQKAGATGLQNPALGSAEEHYPLPLEASPKVPEGSHSAPPSRPSAEGGDTLQPKGAEGGDLPKVPEGQQGGKVAVPDGLYERWASAIRAGECGASVKQSWHWVQKQIAGSQTEKLTFNNREITAVVQLFFSRALRDGYARINPKYTSPKCGFPKYLWIA
jgi:hypothetical protein